MTHCLSCNSNVEYTIPNRYETAGKEHPAHLQQLTQTNNFCFTKEQN
jgi:hypothetical protein